MKIKTKPDKWDILQVCLVTLFVISIITLIITSNIDKVTQCKAFCHCQEVGNCSYTFDYDDIKDCDCGE
jgi:hypothetical protein